MSAATPTSSKREAKVFINYRREDASGYAGRLYEWLSERFGPDRVFMDISAIKPGADFVKAIETEVAACEAVLVLIGRQWLNCAAADGKRRLDNPGDFVRVEIASALSRNVLVIPVLFEDADIPREEDLPDDLKALARRNALDVSDERWEYDVGRLIDRLEERLETRSGKKVARRRVKGPPRHFDLRSYWQLFPVRLIAGLLVLCAALVPQFYLAYRPEPVNLEDTGKFSPVVARLGREELLIEGPLTNSDKGLLLSHIANADEIVDVGFERARLDPDTLTVLRNRNPPSDLTRIDYKTNPAESAESEPCRTFILVRLADAHRPPAALHFYQFGSPGGDILRTLEMKATGGDLLISDDRDMPDNSNVDAPGCKKQLKVEPDFDFITKGKFSVAVVADAESASRFSFNPAKAKNSLWDGPDGLFQPFALGIEKRGTDAPAPLRARAVEIRTLGGQSSGSTSLLSARSLEGGELLNIESLKFGSDRVQVNVSGNGWVKENGKDYVNHLDRIKSHLLVTILLAVADAALIIWFMRLLFRPQQLLIR